MYILLNYLNSAKNKAEDLLKIDFTDEQNNELKKEIIIQLKNNDTFINNKPEIDEKYNSLVSEIEKNTNLKNILLKKDGEEREEILNDLIEELKEMNHLKQIEFLEKKVAKNLDESSYSELIKLKSQLNRE